MVRRPLPAKVANQAREAIPRRLNEVGIAFDQMRARNA
jgi:hypothetical protein